MRLTASSSGEASICLSTARASLPATEPNSSKKARWRLTAFADGAVLLGCDPVGAEGGGGERAFLACGFLGADERFERSGALPDQGVGVVMRGPRGELDEAVDGGGVVARALADGDAQLLRLPADVGELGELAFDVGDLLLGGRRVGGDGLLVPAAELREGGVGVALEAGQDVTHLGARGADEARGRAALDLQPVHQFADSGTEPRQLRGGFGRTRALERRLSEHDGQHDDDDEWKGDDQAKAAGDRT